VRSIKTGLGNGGIADAINDDETAVTADSGYATDTGDNAWTTGGRGGKQLGRILARDDGGLQGRDLLIAGLLALVPLAFTSSINSRPGDNTSPSRTCLGIPFRPTTRASPDTSSTSMGVCMN